MSQSQKVLLDIKDMYYEHILKQLYYLFGMFYIKLRIFIKILLASEAISFS